MNGATKVVKVKLNALFERKDQRVIEEAVRTVHTITSRALLLVKAFYLHWHGGALVEAEPLVLDEDFLVKSFTLVQGKRIQFRGANKDPGTSKEKEDPRAEEKRVAQELERFYDNNIAPLSQQFSNGLSLSHTLEYSATALKTAYLNNIAANFTSYVYKLGHHEMRELVRLHHFPEFEEFCKVPRADRSPWLRHINKAVEDILHHRTGAAARCSIPFLSEWVEAHRSCCVPALLSPKHNLDVDMDRRPWLYLRHMVWMMQRLEHVSKGKVHLMSPLVLRRSFIPTHIRIDTTALIHLLMKDKEDVSLLKDWYQAEHGVTLSVTSKAGVCSSYKKLSGKDTTPDEEEEHQKRVWTYLSKLGGYKDKKKVPWAGVRKTGPEGQQEEWRFDYAICTDGYSMSVQVTRRALGLKKRQFLRMKGAGKPAELPSITTRAEVPKWQHLATTDGVVFVGVDPGKNNLVTMADGDRQVLSVTARERQHYVGEIAQGFQGFQGSQGFQGQALGLCDWGSCGQWPGHHHGT